MAAIVTVGIVIPPLGVGLAALIGRRHFTAEERETGKAVLMMDCVGVTEGAVPFAATDPLHTIPVNMIDTTSGYVTAALMGTQYYAGRDGPIVLPVVQDRLGFVATLLADAYVGIVRVVLLETFARKRPIDVAADDKLDLDFEIN